MWIFMLDTYAGGIGTFPKGHKLDLPPDIIKRIPKDCYKKTCAPWDEKKDTEKIKLTQAEAKAKDAQIWANLLQDKADEAKQKAEELDREAEIKAAEAEKASATAKGATKKETKEKANQLICDARRKILEADKISFLAKAAAVDVNIKQFEADDAKKQAEAAAQVVEQLKGKTAKGKVKKEQDNAKSEAEQSVDEPIDGQVDESVERQIDGVTEGQADEAGQAGQ